MDLQEPFEIEQVSETTYRSKHNLFKYHPSLKGVYGGTLAAQVLIVAIRSAPPGFTPHSLHSYFVKAGLDTKPFIWEIEKISDGRGYCNRIIKAIQDGQIKYIANVSLTKKNSMKQLQAVYDDYQRAKAESPINNNDNDDDDDDDKDDDSPAKPFSFCKPYPKWLVNRKPSDLEITPVIDIPNLSHRLPPEMYNLDLTLAEDNRLPTDRELSWFVKWGEQEDPVTKLALPDEFKYVGLAFLSDSIFLTRMGRVLRFGINHKFIGQFFSVSLDHIIYFHDTDFDPTDWMGFAFRSTNLANDRVLLEAEMFNKNGKHVASIIQEGLVNFGKLIEQAKF